MDNQLKLIKEFCPDKKIKILEIGPYGGKLLTLMQNNRYENLYACDVIDSRKTIKVDKLRFRLTDISVGTSYKANKFDLAILSHVLEHVFNVHKAIIEVKRILKKNGLCLIVLPLDLNLIRRFKILILGKISDPFVSGSHVNFFVHSDSSIIAKEYAFDILCKKYTGLGYGMLDLYLGKVSKKLSELFPSFFAGEMYLVLKNKK
jgi:2-polyprenyl-3-methyl-5-hydroxy-6-metoxy-1,4-benzoquinol methylase